MRKLAVTFLSAALIAVMTATVSAAEDLRGVWRLYYQDNLATVEAQYAGRVPWESLYIRFTGGARGEYAGQWYHRTIPARAFPVCPYGAMSRFTIYQSRDPIGPYPVVSGVSPYINRCDGSQRFPGYGVFAGTFRQANVGASLPRYIAGRTYDTNGNNIGIVLVFDAEETKLAQ